MANSLFIYANASLKNLEGLQNLVEIKDYLDIWSNKSLETLAHLKRLKRINGEFHLEGNSRLTNREIIENIRFIGKRSMAEQKITTKNEQHTKETLELPIQGKWQNKSCQMNFTISKGAVNYHYTFQSKNKEKKGILTLIKEGNQINLLFNNFKTAKNTTLTATYIPQENTIVIQNIGNSTNYFVLFDQCEEKYIHFNR